MRLHPLPAPPCSLRDSPAVAGYDGSYPLCVIDGHCALCSRGARWIHSFDRSGAIRIAPSQSPTGTALLRHFGFDPEDPESWLYIEDGVAFASMEAWLAVARRVGGPGHLLAPFRLLPKPARDWLYRRVARNRYALFGRCEMCAIPDAAFRARLIE